MLYCTEQTSCSVGTSEQQGKCPAWCTCIWSPVHWLCSAWEDNFTDSQVSLFNRSNLETISSPLFQNWPFLPLYALRQNEMLDYACYCQLQTTEVRKKKSKNHKIVKVEINFWRSNLIPVLRAESNKAGVPMPCPVGSCVSWRMKTPSSTTNMF